MTVIQGNVYLNTAIDAKFDATTTVVESVSALGNFTNPFTGQTVYVKSYYAGLGKGGGYRHYDPTKASTNDGVLCINGWVLITDSAGIFAEQAGAMGDGATDDIKALQSILDAKYTLLLSSATYAISQALRVYDNSVIQGVSNNVSFISKYTNAVDSKQNIDAVLLADGSTSQWSPLIRNINLSNFKLQRQGTGIIYTGYGFYAQGVALSTFKNFESAYSANAIYILDSWMNTWDRCTASHGTPWYIGTGTSNTWNSCWATDTDSNGSNKTIYAWDIGGEYHSMVSCGADRVGQQGQPAEAVYNFTRGSSITCTSLGGEVLHVKKLINVSGMNVTIGNFFTWEFYNQYGDSSNFGYFELSNAGTLNIQNGHIGCQYTTATIPTGGRKPTFGTLRGNSIITVGLLSADDKITGIGDGSATQIDHDGTGSVNIYGQTDYTMSSAGTQRTVDASFSGVNQSSFKPLKINDTLRLGNFSNANMPLINFYSAGTGNYVNARIQAYGGSPTTMGVLQIAAEKHEFVSDVGYFSGSLMSVGSYNVTTANAANMNISSDGTIARSTSSKRYKTDITDINTETSKSIIFNSRPIRYRSLSNQDDANNSYYGLIAEEVADLDPRLVHWKTKDVVTEDVTTEGGEPKRISKAVDLDAPIPDGVAYERYVPHLIKVIQDLQSQIDELKKP